MYDGIPHGTRIFVLPLTAIIDAARADAERYRRNRGAEGDGFEVYAFHRRHVRKAMRRDGATGNDILRVALADPGRGLDSDKRELYLQLQEHALENLPHDPAQ